MKLIPPNFNEHFSFLNEFEDSVIWICNPDYKTQLFVSASYENIWLRPCESLYMNLPSWKESLFPEDWSKSENEFKHRGLESSYFSQVKYRILTPRGIRWIRDISYTAADDNQQPQLIFGISEKIRPEEWHLEIPCQSKPSPLITDLLKIFHKEFKLQLLTKNELIMPEDNQFMQLTARENECFLYLKQGLSAKQIAAKLNLSVRTVETYLDKMRKKFNCRSSLQLIQKLQGLLNV